MRRFQEIPRASEDEEHDPDESLGDAEIRDLEAMGHHVVRIGRGFAIVEQCESKDDFPQGWSHDPLRVSVGGDLEPRMSEVFIHAGRYGLMEVKRRTMGRTWEAHWVEGKAAAGPLSLNAAIQFLQDAIGMTFAHGRYTAADAHIETRDGTRLPTGRLAVDPVLKECADNIERELLRARQRIAQLDEFAPEPFDWTKKR